MEKPEKIVLSHLRAADGGARLILQIEKTTAGETERENLTVFSARFSRAITPGELTEEEYERYRYEADYCVAVGVGMRSLGAGTESRARLLQKLKVRGIAPDIAREAAEELARRGFLDEVSGAVREAERGLAKYWGDRRILADLRAKGYPEAARAAAKRRLAEEEPEERLQTLLRRRHIRPPQDEKEAAKLFASLARYGYEPSQIRNALGALHHLADTAFGEG